MAKQIYGLLGGENIGYSLSPVMHNAAFQAFGIDAEYRLFPKKENEAVAFLEDIVHPSGSSKENISGFNVTVPYKVFVKEHFADKNSIRLDKISSIIGAVNTVKISGKEAVATSTDGEGFFRALKTETGINLSGKTVFIAGAGGAGRTIALYLSCLSAETPDRVFVYDIDKNRVDDAVSDVARFSGKNVCFRAEEKYVDKCIALSQLVVNATPIGTHKGDQAPINVEALTNDTVVFDLVYSRETELLKRARAEGLCAADGLGMLINQGALAFSLWTGKQFEEIRDIMHKALSEKIGRK